LNTRKYGYNKGLFLYPRVRRQSSEGWASSELIRIKCPPNSSLPNLSTACKYASKSSQTSRHRRTILEQTRLAQWLLIKQRKRRNNASYLIELRTNSLFRLEPSFFMNC
ncbi:unnamed protein product, partial [Ixodes pacificus]